MRTRDKNKLSIFDVTNAFDIPERELKQLTDQLEDHQLGDVEDEWGDGNYVVELWDREWGGNPFIEILDFCDATGVEVERLLYDLDFALYDKVT